jgi:hypothetical protein
MFRAMPIIQMGLRPLRNANVRWRAAGGLRRTALVVGAVGLTVGSGMLTAGSALASNSIEPGNLIFTPANGASSGTTTWHTTDGCPVGYRASAQMSIFSSKGVLISRISPTVGLGLNGPFSGTLDGKLSAILKFAQIKPGGQLLFVVGCYSRLGGTGNVQWTQSAVITQSSTGKSYAASAGAGSLPSAVRGAGVTGTGHSGSGSGRTDSVAVTNTNATSGAAEAGWIAGACALAVAIAGFVWFRRRNRSRLA